MILNQRWLYNETLHSGVDFSDIGEVVVYDSYMQKIRNIKPEIERVKTAVNLASDDIVLDIGAGTGEMAIGLSEYCKKVIAIDISNAMIEYARRKASERGSAPIVFNCAGFLTFEYPPESLDVVISQFALHHLPDFWKAIALKRIFDVIKPGGRFFLQDTVLPAAVDDYEKFFADVVNQIEAAGGEKVARDAEKTFRDEFVTLDWIMTGLLQKAGFGIIKHDYAAPFVATYHCVKQVSGQEWK